MTTTPNVLDRPLSYRKSVVDLLNNTFDPQIQKANADIADWQEQINLLQSKIGDAKKFIAEIRQLQQHTSDNADLPTVAPLPPLSVLCRSCSMPIVKTADGGWVHAGREVVEHGERCDPKKQSPVAEPAKGPAQAFGDWNGAINEERTGGTS
ncbi:hypothetical protein ACIBHX_01605 [Nonomuraea sp. NPDC050536]|uniref:hypothetical protein n=1 Tax=Nonomuraea sp. NPDC050536 TaxID=3364366 RepID=UPI0037C91938